MKISYLIDTDWVIDHLKGSTKTTERINSHKSKGLAISIITLAELYEGVYFSKDPQKSEQSLKIFLSEVAILGIDEETSKIFAKERGRLRKEGNIIGDFDILIAATALCNDLILLTNNRKHYERIKDLSIESL